MMSKMFRKTLILSLCFFAMVSAIGFVSTSTSNQVLAVTEITVPSEENIIQTAKSDGFYFVQGASVKTQGSGIRFAVKVTKKFADENKGTYIAVLSGKDGAGAQAKAFPSQPTFSQDALDTDIYELFISVDYTKYVTENPDKAESAYLTNIYASAYVKLSDGSYKKAYEPENNQRSMRVVANAAYLDNHEAKLEQYFGETDRTTDETAYLLKDGTGKINLPTVSGETYVGAYVGTSTKNVLGENNTITADAEVVEKMEVGDTVSVSVLTSKGKIIERKAVLADYALNNDNIRWLQNLADGSGNRINEKYIVLSDNVDLSSASWDTANDVWFYGTLNGLGYEIRGMKSFSAWYGSLFRNLQGTVKNLSLINTICPYTGGPIATDAREGARVENVFIQNRSDANAANFRGGLFYRLYGNVIVNNVVVVHNYATPNENFGYIASTSNGRIAYVSNLVCMGTGTKLADTGLIIQKGSAQAVANQDYYMLANKTEYLNSSANGKLTQFLENCISKYL